MSKQKNILYINWGTLDKEYTLRAAKEKGLAVYLATFSNYPTWVNSYVHPKRIIYANTYDSDILIIEVAKFLKTHPVHFDGITTFFEMNIIQTADLAYAFGTPFLNPAAARRSSANKLMMRLTCEQNRIPTPKFAVFSDLKEGVNLLKQFRSPVVIKAVRSGHSYGVMKVEESNQKQFTEKFIELYDLARKQLNANFDEWMQYYNPYKPYFLIEEYLNGTVFSVDGLKQNNQIIFSAVTEYEITPGPYLLQKATFIPSKFSTSQEQHAKNDAYTIMHVLGFDDCGFHIEMKMTKQGPVLLEAAARLPGGRILDIYKEIYDVNLADMFLDLCLGKQLKPIIKNPTKTALVEAKFTDKEGLVTQANTNSKNVSIPGFTLLSYINKGQFVYQVVGMPSMYLYYQLITNGRTQLKHMRQIIDQQFKISIKKNLLYYLLKLHGLTAFILPTSIRNLLVGRGVLKFFFKTLRV